MPPGDVGSYKGYPYESHKGYRVQDSTSCPVFPVRVRQQQTSRSWSKRPKQIVAALASIAAIMLLTARFWLPPVGAFLIVGDPLVHADAIAPLAGERLRVSYAARLLQEGRAGSFAITDMWFRERTPLYTYAELIKRQASREGVLRSSMVVAPGVVASTYAEALALRTLCQRQRWRSLIVVTSPPHTRRARLILREVFAGTGITVAVVPVTPHWYQPDTWWHSWLGWQATLSEYLKLGLYLVGYHRLVA